MGPRLVAIGEAIHFDLCLLVMSESVDDQHEGFRGLLKLFGYEGNVSFKDHPEGGIVVSVSTNSPSARYATTQLAAYLDELKGTKVWLETPDND